MHQRHRPSENIKVITLQLLGQQNSHISPNMNYLLITVSRNMYYHLIRLDFSIALCNHKQLNPPPLTLTSTVLFP